MYFLIVIFIILLYSYGSKNLDYWKRKGVIHEQPVILFGNRLKQFREGVSLSEHYANIYNRYPNERYVGYYSMRKASLLLRDPELIRHVLSADFKYFHHRGLIEPTNTPDVLLRNLVHGDGDIWKLLRQKLTPTFSNTKLKAMFPLIVEHTVRLIQLAGESAESQAEVDVRELMAKYTTDFIGACGFGLDFDSYKSEDSEFRKIGKRIFTITLPNLLALAFKDAFPELTKSIRILDLDIEQKMIALVKKIMTERGYEPSGRNDFIDFLLEVRQKGKIRGESIEIMKPDGTPEIVELDASDELLTAQVLTFFAAGYEPSSHASGYLLHQLAYHPEEQARCRREVDEVLSRYDGKLSYEAVKEMMYLEMALKEALRMIPSPGFFLRSCVHKYTLPGTDLTIDPKTQIIVSLQALHNDPQYFDNPEKFNPSRFEALDKSLKYVYMPFGEGPRSCIGERLAIMQSMAGVAAILSRFTLTPSKNSTPVPRVDPKSLIVQNIAGGLPLILSKRY
ncbi:cytochrome P450 6B2-like [Aricia agestis]|uniref:cytochrome P450 6B2-like n=1 Tax=Aricia agestis TaxID=91739 RepID=UPI001C201CF8|nr:cytochrome P450 6B2-like [Aricia agestis]